MAEVRGEKHQVRPIFMKQIFTIVCRGDDVFKQNDNTSLMQLQECVKWVDRGVLQVISPRTLWQQETLVGPGYWQQLARALAFNIS